MNSTKSLIRQLRELRGCTTAENADEIADRLQMLYQAAGGITVEQNHLARQLYLQHVCNCGHCKTFNELSPAAKSAWMHRALESLT